MFATTYAFLTTDSTVSLVNETMPKSFLYQGRTAGHLLTSPLFSVQSEDIYILTSHARQFQQAQVRKHKNFVGMNNLDTKACYTTLKTKFTQ
jgi:hypothetical protein